MLVAEALPWTLGSEDVACDGRPALFVLCLTHLLVYRTNRRWAQWCFAHAVIVSTHGAGSLYPLQSKRQAVRRQVSACHARRYFAWELRRASAEPTPQGKGG